MPTEKITAEVDGTVKQKAQEVLTEIGMDMTTAVNLLLHTIVREERIPFDLRTLKSYRDEMYRQAVMSELEKSKTEAAGYECKWMSHYDVITKLDMQRVTRDGI